MKFHIDKKLGQQIVYTVKDVCGQNVNFIDCSGIIFASTDEKRIGGFHEIGKKAAMERRTIEVKENDCFAGTQQGVNLPVYYHDSVIAVIGITGAPEAVRKYAHLAERITLLLIREKELNAFRRTQEEERHYLIHNLLTPGALDTKHLEGLQSRWGIAPALRYRVVLIHLIGQNYLTDMSALRPQILQMFGRADIKLHTYDYPDEHLAIVDEQCFIESEYLLKQFASSHSGHVKIAVGKSTYLPQLADSYASSERALKSLSDSEENYSVFDKLALEVILSCVDAGSRDTFLEKMLSSLTEEEVTLLLTYFEEDASLLGTCKKLFLHKNTVQNKLDRIYRKSGFNPRKFRDGVLLYLAVKLRR